MNPVAMKKVAPALAACFALAAACGGRSTLDLTVVELRADGGSVGSGADAAGDGSGDDGAGDAQGDGSHDGSTQDAISITTLVQCGMEACYPATEDCCFQLGVGERCALKGACAGGVPLTCTGSNTCPTGEACCLSLGGGQPSATCKASCGGGGGGRGGGGLQLCTSSSDCPSGSQCVPTPFGVQVCFGGRGGGPVDAGAGG